MAARILTARVRNRALLHRQLLLERSDRSVIEAVEQVGGLQTQYAPSGYIGLWTRLRTFRRDALTEALVDGSVVQGTLLRTTIHMVTRREFWRYAAGIRQARRTWLLRVRAATASDAALTAGAEQLRARLADGPRNVKELDGLADGFIGAVGLWVDLVRVPPSGTWERRRADRLALAESWVGPQDASEAEGRAHLVRAYLRAFGPAAWRDIATWAGVPVTEVRRAGADVDLVALRDEEGGALVDLAGSDLPDEDTPAPVRFLAHWDASLLVHARRTGILPEAYRPRVFSSRNPFSVGTWLVDGHVAGAWSLREGRVVLEPFEAIPAAARDDVEAEREALEAFCR